MTLNGLRKLNRHIKIKGITNLSFKKYGKIVTGYDFTEIIKYMEEKTPIPEEGCVFVPSVCALEELDTAKKLQNNYFGELPIQLGYCNGSNSKLNYLEYHKSNGIILAVTDIVVFLGKIQDISENEYDTKRAEAYFIPEGVAVEIYSTTLCSVPCKMEINGFKCVLISLKGTATPLRDDSEEKNTLMFKNKWLLTHMEAKEYITKETKAGLLGENIEVFVK